jgi:hypothetical protein
MNFQAVRRECHVRVEKMVPPDIIVIAMGYAMKRLSNATAYRDGKAPCVNLKQNAQIHGEKKLPQNVVIVIVIITGSGLSAILIIVVGRNPARRKGP